VPEKLVDADPEEKLYTLAVSKQVGCRNTLRLRWWNYSIMGAPASAGAAASSVFATHMGGPFP